MCKIPCVTRGVIVEELWSSKLLHSVEFNGHVRVKSKSLALLSNEKIRFVSMVCHAELNAFPC